MTKIDDARVLVTGGAKAMNEVATGPDASRSVEFLRARRSGIVHVSQGPAAPHPALGVTGDADGATTLLLGLLRTWCGQRLSVAAADHYRVSAFADDDLCRACHRIATAAGIGADVLFAPDREERPAQARR